MTVEEEEMVAASGCVVVEEPPPALSPDRMAGTAVHESSDEDSCVTNNADTLVIHCEDTEFGDCDETNECRVRERRTFETENDRSDRGVTKSGNESPARRRVESITKPRTSRRSRRARDRRVSSTPERPLTRDRGRTWYVRWTRDGFENIVYAVFDCNEEPNVVFAALCYQRADVYTMVLRNCNGKRRYWYDPSTCSRRRDRFAGPNDDRSGDFERAISWRSKNIGRSSSTPGYDLASFALQNVNTDRRSLAGTGTSLIVITTGGMLLERPIRDQLVCSGYELASRKHRPSSTPFHGHRKRSPCKTNPLPAFCRVCGRVAQTVTQDNASLPTFLCWDHSAAHMSVSPADRTRVYDAVILDFAFVRNTTNGELVCRVRLVDDGALTIAELVASPTRSVPHGYRNDRDASSSLESCVAVGLHTAHDYACQDIHFDDGDLFPSTPCHGIGGGSTAGTVRCHDTTLGRVVDRTYCVVSKFQR